MSDRIRAVGVLIVETEVSVAEGVELTPEMLREAEDCLRAILADAMGPDIEEGGDSFRSVVYVTATGVRP